MYDKLKAAGLHLLVSAIVIGSFLLIVYFIWYPYPFYITEGLSHITIILLGVDLVLGPLMTLILYRKGKKYWLFDLSIVLILQLSAFAYGAVTIAEGRPVYIVFATDVFKTVPPSMIDRSTLKDKSLDYSLFSRPIYIYATAPSDPKEREKLMWSTLQEGKDIEVLPHYYQNYQAHLFHIIQRNEGYKYYKKIKINDVLNRQYKTILIKHGLTQEQIGLFTLLGHEKEVIVIINLNDGIIIGMLDTFF